uniref:Wiskott-Aldrich syndrome protein family member n=1 Tax=Anopheles atroparvus TaxID=41427 RepID=A0AAG5CNC0_ANOAO
MPFVQRVVTPKYIARSSKLALQPYAAAPTIPVADNEFEALTNITLSNALRQLASLVFISNQIFTELHQELTSVSERSVGLRQRLDRLTEKVEAFDPKQVTVPESDLDTFVQIKNHHKTQYHVDTSLFTVASRSETVQGLYEAAAKTPVATIAEMDRIMGNIAGSSSDAFICTPVLSRQRRNARANNVDLDIEVSLPTAVQDLRKWTSSEAIGDVTTGVACSVKIACNSATNNSVLPNISEASVTDQTDAAVIASTSANDDCDPDAITTLAESTVRAETSDDRIDHLLPSPDEQCRVLASKFPAETIKIDTSGRAFDRMSSTRRSALVCYAPRPKKDDSKPEEDTVRRRSRLRRPRGKRRNTIAGTDQREIVEVISKGEPEGSGPADSGEHVPCDFGELVPAIRSKSGDLLRKDAPSFSAEWAKSFNKMSHFNSLKQWGINRLRMINRESSHRDQKDHDIDDFNIHDTTLAQRQQSTTGGSSGSGSGGSGSRRRGSDREKRLSHDRKPSYSSSERSSTGVIGGAAAYLPASINPVKLRETSTIRRQRRTALGSRDEPHSSSGNWSASSESGRTSIGSEITTTNTHPKSSASSTSLNHSNPVSSSAPPSSIVSRRRFFNTSASSSVTSEGTITPDLQTFDYHDEGGETSSVYSCDTEGYYTSFHVDSGLKTLKEEEPMTPLQSTTALSSITSFSSSGNTTIVSQENDYDGYGKGSTSTTTTSSAGTICTVLAEGDKGGGANLPKIPERKSSLTKLNRSNSTASNGTLERSYSSSTLGSTLDSTGTIKRNGVLIQKEVLKILRQENNNRLDVAYGNAPKALATSAEKPESKKEKLPPTAEPEQSESSDVECVERTERLKVKTTINTSRIPSMCIITPTNSDDEHDGAKVPASSRKIPPVRTVDKSGVASKRPSLTESSSFELKKPKDFRKNSLLPLNSVLDRIKGALPHLKKSPTKEDASADGHASAGKPDDGGEYVEISKGGGGRKTPNELTVRRNLATVLSGNLNEETEYVSLNELPCNIKCEGGNFLLVDDKCATAAGTLPPGQDGAGSSTSDGPEAKTPTSASGGLQPHATTALKSAARVKLDANGRVIFSSDSLKRRKGAHTTFAPGPCVKDVSSRDVQCKQPSLALRQQHPVDGDGAGGATTSVNASGSAVTVIPGVRQLKRPLVSARYGAPATGIRIGGPSSIAAGVATSVLESGAKKTLVATILPNSAKSQQPQPPPPQRETRELSNMQSFSQSYTSSIASNTEDHPRHPVAASPVATFYKGAQTNVQSVPHAKPYPEGAHSLDRSSIRHWYPDKLTVGRSGLPTRVEPRGPRGYQGLSSDYEPPRALLAGGFCSPQQASSPQPPTERESPSPFDPHSLYAIPNKPKPPTPLAVGGRSAGGLRPTDRSLRSILAEQSSELSPIKPCQANPFKTSTPSKEDEVTMVGAASGAGQWQNRLLSSSAVRSLGSSPVHSGRSTPRDMLEPQTPRGRHSWASNSVEVPKTCSDRLGTPKTSLMDFKKLLLAHGTKSHASPGSKMSAVEMLKKSKEAAAAAATGGSANRPQDPPGSPGGGNMAILDMSASPKMYSFRRIAQQGNYGGSPTKGSGGKGVGSRSNWRYNNMRTGVISTAIPEANSEEDIQPIDRKPTEKGENSGSGGGSNDTKGATTIPAETVAQLASELEETISNFKENIFLKEDENNFMKGEVPRMAKSFTGFPTAPAPDIARGRLVKELGAKFTALADQEAMDMNEAEKMKAAAALETAL